MTLFARHICLCIALGVLTGAAQSRGATCPPKGDAADRSAKAPKASKAGKRNTVDAAVEVFTIKAPVDTSAATPAGTVAARFIRLSVRLIWGTMIEPAGDPMLDEIEPALGERLHEVFPWKSYFKIRESSLTVGRGQTVSERVSPKALLKVKHLGGSKVRLRLMGEGKKVVHRTLKVEPGDIVTLTGKDENKTGWFIVLKQIGVDPLVVQQSK